MKNRVALIAAICFASTWLMGCRDALQNGTRAGIEAGLTEGLKSLILMLFGIMPDMMTTAG